MPRRRNACIALVATITAILPMPVDAQSAPPIRSTDSVTVAAGPEYAAGGFHRFLLGDGYRDLWTTPIRVPVLDLDRFAGGIEVTEEGGGQQTRSLHFMTEDGREFVFRSVNKFPSQAIPEPFDGPLTRAIFQDQISASFPAGAVPAAPLVEAVGLLHPTPQVAVLPDDPALGEFRDEYAGLLGMIEAYPNEGPNDTPGFAGASKIIGSEELIEQLNESAEHLVDARAYLTGRMLDFVLNDWDRHYDQWRWIGRERSAHTVWEPIPRDRDQVFSRFGGLLLGIGGLAVPQLVGFGARPELAGLTASSADIDRRLLAELEWPVWDSIARFVQRRLTDSVIQSALHRLPPQYHTRIGHVLGQTLAARRAQLPAAAEAFYRELARIVDVHGTDDAETAIIERYGDGDVVVRLSLRDDEADDDENEPAIRAAPAHWQRRFHPAETREVRVYLHGGDDFAVVRGRANDDIRVRVIGGRGDNRLVDSVPGAAGGTRFYDVGSTNAVAYAPDSLTRRQFDRRPWVVRRGHQPGPPPADRGGAMVPRVRLELASDLGLVVGAGASFATYGFRRVPYARRLQATIEYATGPDEFRGGLTVEFRREESDLFTTISASASGVERTRFYGFGNESAAADPDSPFFSIEHDRYRFAAALHFPVGRHAAASIGPVLQVSRTAVDDDRLIGLERPYGTDDFGQVGGAVRIAYDTREHGGAGVSGVRLEGRGDLYPELWDVAAPYGSLAAEAAAYIGLPVPLDPMLALRAGGEQVWGRYPFFAAAFLGGPDRLRGYARQRFAGDAALFGSAELRVPLGRVDLLLPLHIGVLGFLDAGRVYLEGETSDQWHGAAGGGVWFSVFGASNTISLTVARGDETAVYAGAGFAY